PPETYTLSLHDALPILITRVALPEVRLDHAPVLEDFGGRPLDQGPTKVKDEGAAADTYDHLHDVLDEHDRDPAIAHAADHLQRQDRKSTRLNSSHLVIS